MKLQTLILLTGVWLLSACGQNQSSSDIYTYQYPDRKTQDAVFNGWSVTCDDQSQCPESVGQLVIKKDSGSYYEIKVCTVFLVNGGSSVATNSHCVAELNESVCQADATIVFPAAAGRPLERVACKRVAADSKADTKTKPDIAVIDLKQAITVRKSMTIDRTGVADQERLTMYKINPGEQGQNNILKAETCRVVMSPFYLPEFMSAKDPTIALADCELLQGNSGSPLVSKNGLVKAVMFSVIKKTDHSDIKILDHPDLSGKHFNLATNGACFGQTDRDIDLEKCPTPDREARLTALAQRTQATAKKALLGALAKAGNWAIANSKFLVWVMDTTEMKSGTGMTLNVKPACVQPSSKWIAPYKQTSFLSTKYSPDAELRVALPKIQLKNRYDSSYRLYVETLVTTESAKLRFDPSVLVQDKGGSVIIHRENAFSELNYEEINGTAIPACGKEASAAEIMGQYRE